MSLSRRYTPEHPPGENSVYAYDFSFIIPPGIGISSGAVTIFTNVANPQDASSDWTIGAVNVLGRVIYASLTGGIEGKDYQIRWVATDTEGNVWPRTGLQLCAHTS
jgi:hypothetical protein